MHFTSLSASEDEQQVGEGGDQLDMRRVLPIFITIFTDLMGLTIVLPVLALYAASYGADPFTLGLFQASYPLMQFVGAPILGNLSDRYGRRPVLLVTQVGSLIGLLVLGFANSLAWLFVARLVAGVAAANVATAQAALTDITNQRTRTQGLALVGAAFGLGFIFGPILSSVTLTLSGGNYRVPALVGAGFALLAIVLTLTLFRETLPGERRATQLNVLGTLNVFPGMIKAVRQPMIGLLLITLLTQQSVFSFIEGFFSPLMLTRLGLGGVGTAAVFTFNGVLLLIVQVALVGPLSRRFGERLLVIGGLALLATGVTLVAFTPTQVLPGYSQSAILAEIVQDGTDAAAREGITVDLGTLTPPFDTAQRGYFGVGWVFVASIPIALGMALIQPNVNSLITQRVNRYETGAILGVSASFLSLANAIGPLVGGGLAQAFGLTVLYAMGGGVLLLLVVVIALRIHRPSSSGHPLGAI